MLLFNNSQNNIITNNTHNITVNNFFINLNDMVGKDIGDKSPKNNVSFNNNCNNNSNNI